MIGDSITGRTRNRKAAPVIGDDLGDIKGKVGFIMGKLEGIEDRLDQGDVVRGRMEEKIDALPDVIRCAVKPIVDTISDHATRLAALELADAAEKGSIDAVSGWKTKLIGGVGAIGAMVGIVTGLWEAFHK